MPRKLVNAVEQTRREGERSREQLATLPAALRSLADNARVLVRKGGEPARGKCVVYWMQRAQRGVDNPAIDLAVAIGDTLALPVVAIFSVIENYPNANLRHYYFLGNGLRDAEADCHARGIGFVLRRPPDNRLEKFLTEVDAAVLVGDENPIRIARAWRENLGNRIEIPFLTVDADVVVPSRLLEKEVYAAPNARPRLQKLREQWMQPFANPKPRHVWRKPRSLHSEPTGEDITRGWTHLDRKIGPVDTFTGGSHSAKQRLRYFCTNLLNGYADGRRHPEKDGTSRLSPWLHFGHISPARIALAARAEVAKGKAPKSDVDALEDELLVWRELSVNFCMYQEHYDSPLSAPHWAQETIAKHSGDTRDHTYSLQQLRLANTHDDLWNAAQMQMVVSGYMHNRLRMYWAKKILEWSPDIATAFERAVVLNDSYELDGRDPNGYANIAWAIVGKFDRPWMERKIFGKIRYMSAESTGKKFDSKTYITQNSPQGTLAL